MTKIIEEYLIDARLEGKLEGRSEGRIVAITELVEEGLLNKEDAARKLDMSVTELEGILMQP